MQRWVFPLGHTGCLDWRSQFFLWLRSLPTDGLALQTIQLLSWIGQLRRLSIRFGIAMFGLACGTPLTFNEFSRDFVPLWRGLLSSRWEVCEALAGIRTRTVTQ